MHNKAPKHPPAPVSMTIPQDFQPRIQVEQIRALNGYILQVLAANLVVGGAIVYGFWTTVPPLHLQIWYGAMLCMLALRVQFHLRYRRSDGAGRVRRHRTDLILGSALAGILWGFAGIYLSRIDALEYQLFILFTLACMGAGAVSSLTAFMPAFYSYFPITMLPIGLIFLFKNDPIHISLGIMTLIYIVALTYFAHKINRTFVQSLNLRFENMGLVEKLSEQKFEAEQANIAKSRFLAAASHDLRQPLHALTLYTSLLNDAELSPENRTITGQINHSIAALQNLFNALLDISKLEAGTLLPEREHFDLQVMLDRLANDFSTQADAKGIQLTLGDCAAVVYTDPALLEQILRNYLSNAIRYTEAGHVTVQCRPQNDYLNIDVEDTGIGIPPAQQTKIFREFYQVDNPERDRSKGLGLGLAIVQRISRLLDHPIEMRSVAGQGSTFSVTVPRGDATQIRQTDSLQPDLLQQGRLALTVAIVEDDVSVRESTQARLESWGCRVIAAASQAQLMEMLEKDRIAPQAIIADYRLRGGQTGIQVIAQLRKHFDKPIPALIMTGDTAVEQLHELQGSGIQVLHKPVPPARLRALINNIQRHST